MGIVLRVFLIVCAIVCFAFVIRKIRKADIQIADSIFWFLFAFSFILVAIFPQIAFFFSGLLGIDSPSNFIFLTVVALLVFKVFLSSMEIARLRQRINTLSQDFALREQTHDVRAREESEKVS